MITVPLALDFLSALLVATPGGSDRVGSVAFQSVKVASFLRILSALFDEHLLRELTTSTGNYYYYLVVGAFLLL